MACDGLVSNTGGILRPCTHCYRDWLRIPRDPDLGKEVTEDSWRWHIYTLMPAQNSLEWQQQIFACPSEMRDKPRGGLIRAVSHEFRWDDTVEDGCSSSHSQTTVINTPPLIHRSSSFSAGLLVTFINPWMAAFSWPLLSHFRFSTKHKKSGSLCCLGVILGSSWPGHRGASLTTRLPENVCKGH